MGMWFLTFLLLLGGGCEKFENQLCPAEMDPGNCLLISPEKAETLADIVCSTINTQEILGIQLSIRDSLSGEWNMSVGSANLEQNRDIADEHILRIGSVTKMFTATVILKLVEEGLLDLDEEVADYLPSLENLEGVSVRDLLQHTSGIRDIFSMPALMVSATTFPEKQWTPRKLVEDCLASGLRFEPGSSQEYSNTNFILLGLLAEEVSGESMAALYEEYILNPLALTSTFFVPYMGRPEKLVYGYVHRYALSLKKWYPNHPENTSWSTLAFTAGAMASNAQDLSAFTHALFRGDLLGEESLSLMTTFRGDKGLGLFRYEVNGRTYLGHEGEITGFEAITVYEPESGAVISICANTTPFDVMELLRTLDMELR